MITSLSNERIKRILQLKKSTKARREEKLFIVEGIRMFREIAASNIREVYMTEEFYEKYKTEKIFSDIRSLDSKDDTNKYLPRRCELISDVVMEKISDTVTPQGVLALVSCMNYKLEDIISKKTGHILMLEDIQDPGNLGTMFRTAEAAAVNGIIMSRGTVDIYNPKTVRSTMGSIFRMPFIYVDDIKETIKKLRDNEFKIFAAALEGADSCYKADFKGNTAIVIGNEGNGLKKETIAAANASVYIPMCGKVESLNASISAAVLLYEAARQKML